ncbi:HI0074 family nucleotidyltransferase substrate-binding subunit [Mesobacillus subterraneus]|uniref:HI0074 family nucleotidyltransferase substrate-binding subunit n=1 Tax=Mesobacillus subterraneus TaxID=285983 RepID=UPI000A026277|nr:HI0074 family nucleotidyltransferase substrate-binding subunit [Mesobacillus subterraneus]
MKSETKWYGLPKDSFYQLINIFTEYSTIIDKVILFGSRARGDYHLSSDIDLAIKFKNKNEELLHISDRLSEANIIYTLDVMEYDKISNSVLIDFIDKEGIVIFSTNSSGKLVVTMNKMMVKMEDLERALSKLKESLSRDPEQDDIVIDATIKRFEFTYELSWKLMKSYLEYTGVTDLSSPRSTIKAAFKVGLITDGELWLKMLEDRNRTPHTYDESTALDIYNNIKNIYITLLDHACKTLEKNISRD